MRQETNKEIDLLLRRMSRQNGGSRRDGEAHEHHLDVDELSSYAQNALPAKTRARYTEHLAECSTCRKLVTELSLSLNATAAAAAPVETVVEASGLKKFLASLFSPMVLRYAVPALGVIIVGAISFVIFRNQTRQDFVAQVDTKQTSNAPLAASPGAAAPTSSPNMAYDDNAQGRAANPKEAPPKTGDVSGDTAGSGPSAAAPAPAPVATPAPTEDAFTAAQPSVASAPPPAKPDAVTDSEAQKKEEQKQKDERAKKAAEPTVAVQAAETPVKTRNANEPARDANAAPQTGSADRVDESKRESLPVQRRGTFGGVSSAARTRAQTEKDDAETRTVSGRRFRKERGIWTDTAYDSSTPTTSMTRGSEQFRGLVADEPEIKKIAEQLDGEVIVVWKGRAYRIR